MKRNCTKSSRTHHAQHESVQIPRAQSQLDTSLSEMSYLRSPSFLFEQQVQHKQLVRVGLRRGVRVVAGVRLRERPLLDRERLVRASEKGQDRARTCESSSACLDGIIRTGHRHAVYSAGGSRLLLACACVNAPCWIVSTSWALLVKIRTGHMQTCTNSSARLRGVGPHNGCVAIA